MTIHFNKDEQGNIIVKIQKDLELIDFDYVEMIKLLIVDNNIECKWSDLDETEKSKLQELLDIIKVAVNNGTTKSLD